MLKKIIIYSFLMLISSVVRTQTTLDSLINVIQYQEEDTNKVNSYIKAASIYRNKFKLDTARLYLDSVFRLSTILNYNKGNIDGQITEAIVLLYENKTDAALQLLFELEEKLNRSTFNQTEELQMSVYLTLGNIYFGRTRYNQALFFFLKL